MINLPSEWELAREGNKYFGHIRQRTWFYGRYVNPATAVRLFYIADGNRLLMWDDEKEALVPHGMGFPASIVYGYEPVSVTISTKRKY